MEIKNDLSRWAHEQNLVCDAKVTTSQESEIVLGQKTIWDWFGNVTIVRAERVGRQTCNGTVESIAFRHVIEQHL